MGSQGANTFGDDIPLKTHASNDVSESQYAQDHQLYNPEPELGVAEETHRGRRRKKGKPNRFPKKKGRTAWFVYIMTAIQVGVFVGEIIKNCESLFRLLANTPSRRS